MIDGPRVVFALWALGTLLGGASAVGNESIVTWSCNRAVPTPFLWGNASCWSLVPPRLPSADVVRVTPGATAVARVTVKGADAVMQSLVLDGDGELIVCLLGDYVRLAHCSTVIIMTMCGSVAALPVSTACNMSLVCSCHLT